MIQTYRGFFFLSFALGLRLIIWPHLCDASIDSPTGSMGLESIPRIFESGDFSQDRPESFEELAHQSSHAVHSGKYLPDEQLVDAEVNLRKRPIMDGMGGTDRKQRNKNKEFILREHQEDHVATSQTTVADFQEDDFKPLACSELTSICLTTAEYIFRRKNHSQKLQYFEHKLLNHYDNILSRKNSASFRYGETRKLERLPIVVSRGKGSETAVVRLVHPSGTRQGKTIRVSSLEVRTQWLLVAMDFFHNMAFEAGLDKSILGINDNLHDNLMKWFENVLFYQTEDSLPTMGYGEIGDKLPENLENYFGIPQKHLSLFLTLEEGSYSMFFYTILSLMGYWYKHVAPKAKQHLRSKFDSNFDREYWRLMKQELEKRWNIPYEEGKKLVLWTGRKY